MSGVKEDQYFYPTSDAVEDVECYRPGGFHPVHLGDCFDNGRFRVVHKLGSGGFATVWLARDSQLNVYVALKLHQAQNFETCNELRFLEFLGGQNPDHPEDKYFPLLLHHFTINGPNGSHLCLVTTVAGPSIRDLSHLGRRLPAKEARKAAHQVTQALLYLHSLGICHGGNSQSRSFKIHMLTIILDLTGSNVVLQLLDFDCWTEEQLYDRLGQPWIDTVEKISEEPPGPVAPEYLVEPVDFSNLDSRWLTSDIQVIDFGEAFFTASPPSRLGTPLCFLAPECFFELKAGVHSDDWALACVIYMIRAGKPLLHIAYDSSHADAVLEIVHMLGPLPDSWDKMSFDDEGMPKHEKMSYDGEVIPWLEEGEPLKHSLISLVRDIESEAESSDLPSVREANGGNCESNNGGFENVLKPRNVRQRKHIVDEFEDEVPSFGERPRTDEEELKEKERHANALKISEEEVGSLYELLNKVLRYNPEERISTAEIEKHKWFVRDFLHTSETI